MLSLQGKPEDNFFIARVVSRDTRTKRIPSWMSNHPVFCSSVKRISEDHQCPDDPFPALADFKLITEKVRKLPHRELLRSTPGSFGAKLLIASTAVRAYRDRHLGTMVHCCEAWEPVGKCFNPCSFVECINFYGLSQIIANLTRERIAEREAEIHNLPWTQTEKDNALAKCRLSLDPIIRCLHDWIIPRNPAAPDFLQPSPCAYADDFAVAASSFWSLMTALSPPFVVVDWVAGLNLIHRMCYSVQYGSDSCHELL